MCGPCARRITPTLLRLKEADMFEAFSWFALVAVVLFLVLALQSFGINQEYQRGVVFRLGRLVETKGPGWFWLIPLVERVVKIDQRVITFALATQETVTRDGVAVKINDADVRREAGAVQVNVATTGNVVFNVPPPRALGS